MSEGVQSAKYCRTLPPLADDVGKWRKMVEEGCGHMFEPPASIPQFPPKCNLIGKACSHLQCPRLGLIALIYNEKTGKYRMQGEKYPNRWSGTAIYLTKDCGGCSYFTPVKADDDERVAGICFKGAAWKVLVQGGTFRKCAKKEKGVEN